MEDFQIGKLPEDPNQRMTALNDRIKVIREEYGKALTEVFKETVKANLATFQFVDDDNKPTEQPNVKFIELEFYEEYNDEGGTNTYCSCTSFDENGEAIDTLVRQESSWDKGRFYTYELSEILNEIVYEFNIDELEQFIGDGRIEL